MGRGKRTAKHQRPAPGGSRLGVMDIILIIVGLSLLAFTVTMIGIYRECGGVPDTLITCVFATLGGECGIMGWIKTTKDRNKERKWEQEDKREAQEPPNERQGGQYGTDRSNQ